MITAKRGNEAKERMRDAPLESIRISAIVDAEKSATVRRLGAATMQIRLAWVTPARGEPGRYELLAGRDAVNRAALAGHATVLGVVTRGLSDEQIERCKTADRQRRLHDIAELAVCMREWASMPDRQIAKILLREKAEISRLRDLTTASEELRVALGAGQLTMGHARYILPLPHGEQADWVATTIAKGWTVKDLATARREGIGSASPAPSAPGASTAVDPEALRFEEALSAKLGTPVELHGTTLHITWYGVEQLKGIFRRLAESPEMPGRTEGEEPRRLIVALATASEVDALVGPLDDL